MSRFLNSSRFTQLILLFFFGLFANAQGEIENQLIDHYEDFSAAPRELVYVHLNKSTYVEGEMLGFT
ncbi:MAG: hypothetical protein HKP28_09065, partial [Winogradskyella sp.]|nr:hypothetical protein [Winogradskyella sp.]